MARSQKDPGLIRCTSKVQSQQFVTLEKFSCARNVQSAERERDI